MTELQVCMEFMNRIGNSKQSYPIENIHKRRNVKIRIIYIYVFDDITTTKNIHTET